MESLKILCRFHDADWVGILILDRTAEMWGPAAWYEPGLGEMGPTLFNDIEYFESFPRWVQALKDGTPVIIRDTDTIPSEEAAQYARLAAHSVIGIPFGDRPTGFLVVRNPMRYPDIPDFAKMMAFVTLSSYYLQELQSGMQMMYESSEEESTDGKPAGEESVKRENIKEPEVTLRLFCVPAIISPTGQISAKSYHSENGWKLLTYLALRRNPVPARNIAAALWPDEDQNLSTDRIRHVIYRFKSKLTFLQPYDLIVNTATGYALNPKLRIHCDIYEFERLCALAEGTLDRKSKIGYLKKAVGCSGETSIKSAVMNIG